jgi:hypothetical protein
MENPFFSMATQKTLVTKVGGNGKMHITAANGVKIQKFAIELAQTKHNWVEKQSEVLLGGIFCEDFFYETLICHVWYFS